MNCFPIIIWIHVPQRIRSFMKKWQNSPIQLIRASFLFLPMDQIPHARSYFLMDLKISYLLTCYKCVHRTHPFCFINIHISPIELILGFFIIIVLSIYPSPPQVPDNQIPLTQKGEQQAQDAGVRLKEILGDDNITFYVSPFLRSRQTYHIIAEVGGRVIWGASMGGCFLFMFLKKGIYGWGGKINSLRTRWRGGGARKLLVILMYGSFVFCLSRHLLFSFPEELGWPREWLFRQLIFLFHHYNTHFTLQNFPESQFISREEVRLREQEWWVGSGLVEF